MDKLLTAFRCQQPDAAWHECEGSFSCKGRRHAKAGKKNVVRKRKRELYCKCGGKEKCLAMLFAKRNAFGSCQTPTA